MLGRVVNVPLITNPYNWFVVILMLAIAVFALAALRPALDSIGQAQASAFGT
jgi:hypothetical protein